MSPASTEPSLLERRYQGERPLRTLLTLYRPERRRLILAAVFFVIKHSPVWMLPALTANIIDIISTPGSDVSGLWFNALVLVLLLVQNVPLHTLYARYLSQAVRATETRLRAAICRRLQHLSISFYTRQSAASLQTKVLRDVENIEQLTEAVLAVSDQLHIEETLDELPVGIHRFRHMPLADEIARLASEAAGV